MGVSVTVNNVDNNVGAYVGDGQGSDPAVNISRVELSFDAVAGTLTRSDGGSWIADNYDIGDWIRVSNLSDSTEDGLFRITSLNATILTLEEGAKSPGNETSDIVAIQKMGRFQADGVAVSLDIPALQFDFIHDPNASDRIVRNDGGDWGKDGFFAGQNITIAGSADNDDTYEIETIDGETIYLVDADLENEFSVTGISVVSDAGKVSVTANNSSVIVTTSLSGSPLLLEMKDSAPPPSSNAQNATQKRSIGNKALGGQKMGVQEPGKIALNGTFSLVDIDNTTTAHVDGGFIIQSGTDIDCLLYTSPSPRD